MTWFGVVSLFPEMLQALRHDGVLARALENKLLQIECFNPRDFAIGNYKSVDDQPYGGGPGMLMRPSELSAALAQARARALELGLQPRSVLLSPQGSLFDNERARSFAAADEALILICGRYEGIDQRFIDAEIDLELSIGDYIITGGELAAMVVIDATMRFAPGVLGNHSSSARDSLSDGLLKYPQYTRDKNYAHMPVPEVLRSGNHALIERWRRQQSLGRTWQRRPELLQKLTLSLDDQQLLREYQNKASADK